MDCHKCELQDTDVARAMCAALFLPAMVNKLFAQVAELKTLCLQQLTQELPVLNEVVLGELPNKTDIILSEYEDEEDL